MKHRWKILVLLIVGVGIRVGIGLAYSDQAEIRRAFESFRAGILAEDSQAVQGFLSQASRSLVQELREEALSAPAIAVRNAQPMRKLMVLALRFHLQSAKDSRGSDQEWMPPPTIALGSLTFLESAKRKTVGRKDQLAWVLCEVEESGQEFPVFFVLEADEWKYDLQAVLDWGNLALSEAAAKSDWSEDQIVLSALQQVFGEPIPDSIWLPIED